MSVEVVYKFGGSSLRGEDEINNVISIIAQAKTSKLVVVVSACEGVTNTLHLLAKKALNKDKDAYSEFTLLKKRYLDLANSLLKDPQRTLDFFDRIFKELFNQLKGISLLQELTLKVLDQVLSCGERLTAFLVAEALTEKLINAEYVDARNIFVTDHHHGNATVLEDETLPLLNTLLTPNAKLRIVTGFIGKTKEGETTTLGRGGSDFTAALLAKLLGAKKLVLWTDVDGVMSTDPRIVPKARHIPKMTYEELMELSYFGSKVVHPKTVRPAISASIPILIKNTFNPSHPGTLIVSHLEDDRSIARALTFIPKICLIRVEADGSLEISLIATKMLTLLSDNQIQVFMISQSSSQHSLCVAIPEDDALFVKDLLIERFDLEMAAKKIKEIAITKHQTLLAIIGKNMREKANVCGTMFHVLGIKGILIRAIALESSGWNITCVIESNRSDEAIKLLHQTFFETEHTSLRVYQAGVGGIGKTLLDQLIHQSHQILKTLDLVGLANSTKQVISNEKSLLPDWERLLKESKNPSCPSDFIESLMNDPHPNKVFLDLTASVDFLPYYQILLQKGIPVITSNKKGLVTPYPEYRALKEASTTHKNIFFYKTTVGAGLPILKVLENLRQTKDDLENFEALLSGTLNTLLITYDGTVLFSKLINQLKNQGITEPDPMEDLSGQDVARKLLILIRESGFNFELDQIKCTPLVPQGVTLEAMDFKFKEKIDLAHQKNCVLRYIARFDGIHATCQLEEVDSTHPFYSLEDAACAIRIISKRSKQTPYFIKGPGAGKEVTAAMVLTELLEVKLKE